MKFSRLLSGAAAVALSGILAAVMSLSSAEPLRRNRPSGPRTRV